METPDRHGIILDLRPKEGADFATIITQYANGQLVDLSKFDIFMCHSAIDHFRTEFIQYITEYGLSSYLRREQLVEAIIPRKQSPNQIEAFVRKYIDRLGPTEELIIIDPYFLASTRDSSYTSLVERILDPILVTLTTLKVITLPHKVDVHIKADIEARLLAKNGSLSLSYATSDAFHDRFWINRTAMKGFVMGTSLNGLGKRYALLDHLSPTDVRDLITALGAESLA